jgi:hypothetical protein
MPLSVEQQAIFDFIAGALPKWFTSSERALEDLHALVAAHDLSRQQIDQLFKQAKILTADGPIAGDPDWLNQHAIDRGTHRQAGESDESLRERLRTFEDAVTVPALLALMGAMLDADGVTGDYEIIELHRDGAYLVVQEELAGTASGSDAFAKTGDVMTLTLDGVAFQGGMLHWDRSGLPPSITIAGSTSPANDGTFTVTGFDGDSIQWENPAGVAESFSGTWSVMPFDGVDDYDDAYCDCGYRVGGLQPSFVAVLPFGTSEALRLAVHEAIRQRKAAGVRAITEARTTP